MITQLLLQYRVEFAGFNQFNWTHIQIKGNGIIVQDIDRDEALEIIQRENLNDVSRDEYDYHYGKVYTDGKFKEYVNSRPKIKATLLHLLEQLDKW